MRLQRQYSRLQRQNRGYVVDAFIVSFVYALFKIANQMKKEEDWSLEGVDRVDLKFDEGLDTMLDDWIEGLEKEMIVWIRDDKRITIASRVKSLIDTRMHSILLFLQQYDVNLEVLGAYIMYLNFVKRSMPLHSDFEQFADESKYSLIVDTMSSAGYGTFKKIAMHNLANDVLLRIK